jgi:hypothetical protein
MHELYSSGRSSKVASKVAQFSETGLLVLPLVHAALPDHLPWYKNGSKTKK